MLKKLSEMEGSINGSFTYTLRRLIHIFQSNKELLSSQGWVVGDPYSYSWWGGMRTPDEIAISAFLVQLTKWEVVREVMMKLRENGISNVEELSKMDIDDIDKEISKVNFHKTKARRLKAFSMEAVKLGGVTALVSPINEEKLLEIEGIGKETAKSLLLFISNARVFPPSSYSAIVLGRVIGRHVSQEEASKAVAEALSDIYELKLMHAGLISVGKAYCNRKKPKCHECILRDVCHYKLNTISYIDR
ncbi:DNA endonuclease III [Thermocladium modestius]|uniref:DNA endonuclease III n=2 Tax=Thermocladium modestius TaxID=62609 RepID=A0A830GV19_9CREN|nr:DNA endonuclease III [Thermocladium modestius]